MLRRVESGGHAPEGLHNRPGYTSHPAAQRLDSLIHRARCARLPQSRRLPRQNQSARPARGRRQHHVGARLGSMGKARTHRRQAARRAGPPGGHGAGDGNAEPPQRRHHSRARRHAGGAGPAYIRARNARCEEAQARLVTDSAFPSRAAQSISRPPMSMIPRCSHSGTGRSCQRNRGDGLDLERLQ
jgi:hypothetical protein